MKDKYSEVCWQSKPDDINDALSHYRNVIEELKNKANKVIVEVQGGVVQAVYADKNSGVTEFYVLDYDNVEAGDDAGELPKLIETMERVY